ncbi:MAG: transglycosylase domain-containing protein, partial [Armatimonadota bacterium]
YEHSGVDPWALGRIVVRFVSRSEKGTTGGSTITMQLAKKLFSASEKTGKRKLQDIAIAIQLEKRYTKDQILELYLNQIYYGEQAYGLNAAANIYFGKKAQDLDIAEAAMIARCIRTPSKENPVKNYQLADSNKLVVLKTMLEEGWISQTEFDKAQAEKPKIRRPDHQSQIKTYMAPYYVAAVRRDLDRLGINISEGGYSITTTLDSDLQKDAEESVRQHVREGRGEGVNVGAFLCMDSQGRILADVGGRDFGKNQYSYTTQSTLQPGSSFKSFIYSEALKENRIGEDSEISNEKYTWKPRGGKAYTPKNHGGYGGTVSLTRAFASSINVPAVRTFVDMGMDTAVAHIVEDFGFSQPMHAWPATALGSCEVRMQEMLEAYSVFMLDGKRVQPFRIKEIAGPTGELLYQGKMDYVNTRIGPDVCNIMDHLLRAVVTNGTGHRAGECKDAHGKTGTTNDGKSGWFCGYAKGVVGVAWAGREYYDRNRKKWFLHELPETFGGDVAAPIWADAMISATKKFGSDIKPNNEIQPGERRRPADDTNDANNAEPADDGANNIPIEPDTQNAPPVFDPNKTSDTNTEPQRDPASDGRTNPDNPATEPKKPKGDKTKKTDKTEDEFVEVEVCADTGLLVTRYCPETINKRFLKSKKPKRRCTLHKAPNENGDGT